MMLSHLTVMFNQEGGLYRIGEAADALQDFITDLDLNTAMAVQLPWPAP